MIAVIDDDDSVRRALARLFRSVGWQDQTFATAEDFLETTDEQLLDCLILDVHLPGMGGLALQKELACAARQVPIVFITADPHVRENSLRSGAVALLHKPFDEQRLLDAVGQALAISERDRGTKSQLSSSRRGPGKHGR